MFNIYKLILFVVLYFFVEIFYFQTDFTIKSKHSYFMFSLKRSRSYFMTILIRSILLYTIMYLFNKYYFKSNEGFEASLNATGDIGYYLQYIISNDSNNNHVLQAKTYHDKFQNGSLQQSDYTTMAKFANSVVGSSSSPSIQQAAKYIISKSS